MGIIGIIPSAEKEPVMYNPKWFYAGHRLVVTATQNTCFTATNEAHMLELKAANQTGRKFEKCQQCFSSAAGNEASCLLQQRALESVTRIRASQSLHMLSIVS